MTVIVVCVFLVFAGARGHFCARSPCEQLLVAWGGGGIKSAIVEKI